MADQFSWVPFYSELADRLLDWESRQDELIAFLEQLRAERLIITPLKDHDANGDTFLIREIDPFTFFATFNRGTEGENRIAVVRAMARKFDVPSDVPLGFHGIPVVFPGASWFIAYADKRQPDDVQRLWRVFRLALGENPWNNEKFWRAFEDAQSVRQVKKVNLTMGLFWIRPKTFLSLDNTNQAYLNLKLPTGNLSSDAYRSIVSSVRLNDERPFYELSRAAYLKLQAAKGDASPASSEPNHWLVGSYWDADPPDQTERFLAEGIWQNGYDDKYLSEVKSMAPGDRIAIKSSFTQKHDLPFDSKGKTASAMTIKAIGTITSNRGDGHTVDVQWEGGFHPKHWFHYTGKSTVWRLRQDDEKAQKLIAFVFGDAEQDIPFFAPSGDSVVSKPPTDSDGVKPSVPYAPYTVEDVIASGVFLDEQQLRETLQRLLTKKNLVLQGPPGVGKTFLARMLAFAFLGKQDPSRVETCQFHPAYSYEDFVRGFRPAQSGSGGFSLHDGVFLRFCKKAMQDPERPYVFVIDEINRGNLSQIFGELLMLLEADKRRPAYAVKLVNAHVDEETFFVPENVHLIGLMNLADRSLALVDYALRRRFAFVPLRPQFESAAFRTWLEKKGVASSLVDLIVNRIVSLNKQIREDQQLGENYEIGHSYFCPNGDDSSSLGEAWYNTIIRTEIAPLLNEYWFDDADRARKAREDLIAQ